MALSPQKPRKISGGILAIVFSLLSVIMLTVWSGEGGVASEAQGVLHTVRSGFSVVLTPFQQVGSVVGVPFSAMGNAFSNLTASSSTLDELQAKNDELSATVMRLEEYRQENERLSKLLEITDAYNLEATGARILRPATESWNQVITIDKGGFDGLAVGMPVMSPNGLIGQIESVGPFTSVVRLITDQNSGVAVFLQANRSEGVVVGSIDGMLYLSYISISINVVPGDVVITSGAGGVYPKGIVIGEVTSATYTSSDVYQTIVVKPVARVSSFEEVLILTGRQSEVKRATSTDNTDSANSTDKTANETSNNAQPDENPLSENSTNTSEAPTQNAQTPITQSPSAQAP